jgi:hypothetical protein
LNGGRLKILEVPNNLSLNLFPVLVLLSHYIETGELIECEGNPFLEAFVEDVKLSLGLVDTNNPQVKWFHLSREHPTKKRGLQRVLIYSGRIIDISTEVIKKYYPLLQALAILYPTSSVKFTQAYGFSQSIRKDISGVSPTLFKVVGGSVKKFFNPTPTHIKKAFDEYFKEKVMLNRLLKDASYRKVEIWLEWENVVLEGKEIPYMIRLHTYVYFERSGGLVADIEFYSVVLNNFGFTEINIDGIELEVKHRKPGVFNSRYMVGKMISIVAV